MTVTCALAVVITLVVGLLTAAVGGKDAAADAREIRDLARDQLVAIGWQPPSSESLRALSEDLRASHGVEIMHAASPFRLELANGTIVGGAASEGALAAATVLLSDELKLLPASFVEAARLWRVVLCSGLNESGRPIPSLPNYRNTLIIDVDASPRFLRRLVHHELLHFADLADDGSVLSDPAWERLNVAGFRYGYGGRSMRQPSAGSMAGAPTGFATPYATSALEEDKAEVFALLVTQPTLARQRSASDAVLRAKILRMKAMLAALAADMDEQFWRRLDRARMR